jgi:hypothetical protein
MTPAEIDELARRHWHWSLYSGRDGQDFDHQAFARELLATAVGTKALEAAPENTENDPNIPTLERQTRANPS